MRVLDLFSGIGGFALGLESVGMQTVAFCEQDGYARRVLEKHWPESWIYEDVRTLTAKRLKTDGVGPIDLICGGFPCQDISCAGKGAGIEGSRSGLWSEYFRLIREIRPRWVIAENVPALRGRGADKVLSDLESAKYTVWPLVVGAIHAGAPHQRQRAWIVACAQGERCKEIQARRQHQWQERPQRLRLLANAAQSNALQGNPAPRLSKQSRREFFWSAEPDVGRVADGVPARVDRLRCLGNAVVPQVVAMIGQAVLEADSHIRSVHCLP